MVWLALLLGDGRSRHRHLDGRSIRCVKSKQPPQHVLVLLEDGSDDVGGEGGVKCVDIDPRGVDVA